MKKTVKKTIVKKLTAKQPKPKPSRPTAPARPSAIVTAASTITTDPVLKSALAVSAQASLVKVTDAASEGQAGTMLVQLKQMKQQVEDKKNFVVKPLKEHVKRLEAMFKPTLEKLDVANQSIRTKVLAYREEAAAAQREEQAKLMEKATEAQEAGDNESALALATQAQEQMTLQKTNHLDEGSVQAKSVWTFEVTDFGAVPHEFFTLDEKKVNAAIRAGQRDVPGIRIFQKQQLAVSSGSMGDEVHA